MKAGTITVAFLIVLMAVIIMLHLGVSAIAEAQQTAKRTTGGSLQANNTSTVVNEPGLGEYGINFGPGGYGFPGVSGVGGPALPYSTGALGGRGNASTGNLPGTGTNNSTSFR